MFRTFGQYLDYSCLYFFSPFEGIISVKGQLYIYFLNILLKYVYTYIGFCLQKVCSLKI